ncbi:MAG: prolyl-tRNA synthetase associated domain-containing protein [Pseudomonadota bacterium]
MTETDAPSPEIPFRLLDGATPAGPQELLARLEALGLESTTVEHAPVFTVEESQALCGDLPGGHIKNLFLRNKKGRMWLVTCLEDQPVDLKALTAKLEAGRLSFGSAQRLMDHLGIRPGSVTPFAVMNDPGGQVQMVLEKKVLEENPVNCHPLVNHMTTALSPTALLQFLEAEGHPPLVIDLEA